MAAKPMRFSIWYFLSLLLVLVLVQTFFSIPRSYPVNYSDFRHLIDMKGVDDLEISSDSVNGVLLPQGVEFLAKETKDPDLPKRLAKEFPKQVMFTTVRVEDKDLIDLLEQKGIKYKALPDRAG